MGGNGSVRRGTVISVPYRIRSIKTIHRNFPVYRTERSCWKFLQRHMVRLPRTHLSPHWYSAPKPRQTGPLQIVVRAYVQGSAELQVRAAPRSGDFRPALYSTVLGGRFASAYKPCGEKPCEFRLTLHLSCVHSSAPKMRVGPAGPPRLLSRRSYLARTWRSQFSAFAKASARSSAPSFAICPKEEEGQRLRTREGTAKSPNMIVLSPARVPN